MEKQIVKLVREKQCFADYGFNSRKNYGSKTYQSNFAESMKNGQLVPCLVSQPIKTGDNKGKHLLLAGYRRYMALEAIGCPTVDCIVLDVEAYSLDARMVNAKENVEREDLSTYDIARMIIDIGDEFHLKDSAICDRLRGSRELNIKYVNNLKNCFKKLDPSILDAWRLGHPVCRTDILNRLRDIGDHEAQVTEFKRLCEIHDLPEGGQEALDKMAARNQKRLSRDPEGTGTAKEGEKEGEKEGKIVRPSSALVEQAISLVRETELPITVREAALRALQWCNGLSADLVIGKELVYSAQAAKELAAKEKAAKSDNEKLAAIKAKRAKMEKEERELEAKLAKGK